MDITALITKIKAHPDYNKVGMILCHNGVVRGTSRDGRSVDGLTVSVDRQRLTQILEQQTARPGIVDIRVRINENQRLAVGDDVMLLAVAGDIRDHVIQVLHDTLDAIKKTVTSKTEYYSDTSA